MEILQAEPQLPKSVLQTLDDGSVELWLAVIRRARDDLKKFLHAVDDDLKNLANIRLRILAEDATKWALDDQGVGSLQWILDHLGLSLADDERGHINQLAKQVRSLLQRPIATAVPSALEHDGEPEGLRCSCKQCGHLWSAQIGHKPERCPLCFTRNWEEPLWDTLTSHEAGHLLYTRWGKWSMQATEGQGVTCMTGVIMEKADTIDFGNGDSEHYLHEMMAVDRWIEQQTERDRKVIKGRYYQSKRFRDIGAEMGFSEGWASKRMKRLCEELSDFFEIWKAK
uniref:RNA polymerase sigma-70 region 4 domain-containing protein n=1 Tax=Magnetococcus massalia (strain MO-1) TaxID=451514 RepID=A0A1S7LHM3_MAGMO|nr:protein of unknown function [include the region 4 domain of Sigma-70] [Candidatus Magnetococcus massalia]